MSYATALGALPSCLTPEVRADIERSWSAQHCGITEPWLGYYQANAKRMLCDQIALVQRTPDCKTGMAPSGQACTYSTDAQYAACIQDRRARGETLTAAEERWLKDYLLRSTADAAARIREAQAQKVAEQRRATAQRELQMQDGALGTGTILLLVGGVALGVWLLARRRRTT